MNKYTLPQVFDLLFDEITKVKDEGFGQFDKRSSYPKVDLYHTDDYSHFVLDCAVPGWSKDDLSVEVGEDYVAISGQKSKNETLTHPYIQELKKSSFTRTFNFAKNSIDKEKAETTFSNGILTVKLENIAKKSLEKAKPKLLEVKEE